MLEKADMKNSEMSKVLILCFTKDKLGYDNFHWNFLIVSVNLSFEIRFGDFDGCLN